MQSIETGRETRINWDYDGYKNRKANTGRLFRKIAGGHAKEIQEVYAQKEGKGTNPRRKGRKSD